MTPIILIFLWVLLVWVCVFFIAQIHGVDKNIRRIEQKIISLHKEKIDKIPAFVEIMSKHTGYKDIFLEITALHRTAIISSVSNIYDILENGGRIHREFMFLMKVSTKIRDLNRDGNFLYVRDFIIFYENTIAKELLFLNSDILRYNELIRKKDRTIVGLLFPFKKRISISN